jgi:hypothetical protein
VERVAKTDATALIAGESGTASSSISLFDPELAPLVSGKHAVAKAPSVSIERG